MSGGELRLFTIYQGPAGAPVGRRFSVREWIVTGSGAAPGVLLWARSLDEARRRVPAGAGYRLGREPSDEAAIVESWI